MKLSTEEIQTCPPLLFHVVFGKLSDESERASAIESLSGILENQKPISIPISQGWLAELLIEILGFTNNPSVNSDSQIHNQQFKAKIEKWNIGVADQAAKDLVAAVATLALEAAAADLFGAAHSLHASPLPGLLCREPFAAALRNLNKKNFPKFDSVASSRTTSDGIKALTEVCADDSSRQSAIADFGVLCLLRHFLLRDDYGKLGAYGVPRARTDVPIVAGESKPAAAAASHFRHVAHIRRHAARLLTILSPLEKVQTAVVSDGHLCNWLDECASGKIPDCDDPKLRSYARATLLNVICNDRIASENSHFYSDFANTEKNFPRPPCYGDNIFLINPERPHWKGEASFGSQAKFIGIETVAEAPLLDVVFVHGLRGGPYKSWRIPNDKFSKKFKMKQVAHIDHRAEKPRKFWPCEWLSSDISEARVFTIKYKTNLTAWFEATLPLQDISSMLLEKLVTAGIGDHRPVVFITHSMGGLVVKQMLYEAKAKKIDNLVNNTTGVVFYSCPHFGSKLANVSWAMRTVLHPSPVIRELRRGSPRLAKLNDFINGRIQKRQLEVLSFCETKRTRIFGCCKGSHIRMKIVPRKSAKPGFGEVVELESTDHINSCKPRSRTDSSYEKTLEFLHRLKARIGYKKSRVQGV